MAPPRRPIAALFAAGVLLLCRSELSSAEIGYLVLGDPGRKGPEAAIAEAGHVSVAFDSFAEASLEEIDLLWILAPYAPDVVGLTDHMPELDSFVRGGGIVAFHHRRGVGAASVLPGGSAISFQTQDRPGGFSVLDREFGVVDGPGGVVSGTSFSFLNVEAFAEASTLPAGAIPVFHADSGLDHIVEFVYPYGSGLVYSSTLPVDNLFDRSGREAAVREVYAVNLLHYLLGEGMDSDGDGISARLEAGAGLDPQNAGDALLDSDGDGLTNLEEMHSGTAFLVADTDADGLADSEEVTAKTDPLAADTDGDGFPDGSDAFPRSLIRMRLDVPPAGLVGRTVRVPCRLVTGDGVSSDGLPVRFTLTVSGSATVTSGMRSAGSAVVTTRRSRSPSTGESSSISTASSRRTGPSVTWRGRATERRPSISPISPEDSRS